MTDPLNSADDGGLNISDTQDWADPKTTNVARMMALIVFPCIFLALCGVAVVLLLQGKLKMSAAAPKPQAVASSTLPAVVSEKDAEIASLRNQLLTLQSQAAPVAGTSTTPAPTYNPDPVAIAQLSSRLDRIEANQRALAHAAAAANAAAALQVAARTSGPFLSQLALVEPSLNDPNLVAPLRPYAEHGVASEVALTVDFPAVAARANIAAKTDGHNGLLAMLQHATGISIRRTDSTDGQDVETLLHRAEIQLNNGDLHGAVANLNALPPSAQTAIKPWLDQARARLVVDDTTQRVTEVALSHLSQSGDSDVPAQGPTQGGVL